MIRILLVRLGGFGNFKVGAKMASGEGVKVILYAVIGNGFITIIKFIGWAVSASPSLLAEAIHSLADTLNQILLFVGIKQSKKEASDILPTGSGNARYMWNLISAVGIFFLGFGLTFYHGIHALLEGDYSVGPVNWIAIGVLIVAFIIEYYVLLQAWREVQKNKGSKTYAQFIQDNDNPAVLAVLLEDGIAVIGVVLALGGIVLGQIFGNALFDIIASIIISILLAILAVLLGIMNSRLLLGKSLSTPQEDAIKKFILDRPEVERIEDFSTKILGAGQVRLSVGIELIGEKIIDFDALKNDIKKLEGGDAPLRVLTKSSGRMVRLTGETINHLERSIQEKFPQVLVIDFEVN